MAEQLSMGDVRRIIIDPRCKFNYASYLIEGLIQTGVKWKFSLDKSFLAITSSYSDYTRGFCMIVEFKTGSSIKVYVDNHDLNDILEIAYDWCDVYATVNIDQKHIRKKVLPIGPTCALRVYGPLSLCAIFLSNFCKIRMKRCYYPGTKNMLRDYFYTIIRRLPYSFYSMNRKSDDMYCFSMSTLWHDDLTDKETNNWRLIYTKICKRIFPVFEGGFFKIPGEEAEWPKYALYTEKYKGLTFDRRIPLKEYIEKTQRSAIVFNTPAVELCLGWKLTEYLMMGKAIISTPILNVLPGHFCANEQFLLVTNETEMENAIIKLRQDHYLREKLEHNARRYFDKYLAPCKIFERIVQFALALEE